MTDYPVLVEIATDQHGLVARSQALAEGVPGYTLDRYLERGLLAAVGRGIYHLTAAATDALTPYQQATLWGGRNAVISHASTLEMLGLCDISPARMHVTIPRDRRIRDAARSQHTLHRLDLPPQDVTVHVGIPTMAPRRAITEAIRDGEDPHQMSLAIRAAARQGYLTRGERASLVHQVHKKRVA